VTAGDVGGCGRSPQHDHRGSGNGASMHGSRLPGGPWWYVRHPLRAI